MTSSDRTPSAEERFRQAVREANVGELRRLLPLREALRSEVNAPSFAFDSPALVHLAGRGDVDLVDAVLALGADPNKRSEWWAGGFHPLYVADDRVTERLLAAGAVPDACAAARMGRVDLLTEMLREDPQQVHQRGGDGQTPLHFARTREVAALLLGAGADIDARDVDHRSTPAQWMLGDIEDPRKSRADVARYLVERGAEVDIFLAAALGLTSRVGAMLEQDPSLLTLRTGEGAYGEKPPSSYHIYFWTIGQQMTPLQTAARFGHRETLDAMRRFASPEQLLLVACHEGNRHEAVAIAASHPGIVQRITSSNRGALTAEAWAANAPAVALMLELGFDPAITGTSGPMSGTALHCGAWVGCPECVKAALDDPRGRALLETRDTSFNSTPFGWCCHGSLNCGRMGADHAGVARLLLGAGARIQQNPEAIDASNAVKAVIREMRGPEGAR